MPQFQRSSTGAWHIVKVGHYYPDGVTRTERNIATCRYQYNGDRPIALAGEVVDALPDGATLCKKCATHLHKPAAAPAPVKVAPVAPEVVYTDPAYTVGQSFTTRGGMTLTISEVKPGETPRRIKYRFTCNGKPAAEWSEYDLLNSIKRGDIAPSP